jgi:Flp pilus assembly pilin Flp
MLGRTANTSGQTLANAVEQFGQSSDPSAMPPFLPEFFSRLISAARRSEGQTMAEYGILIAVIALIVVVAAIVLGGSISGLFGSTAAQV